MDFAFFDQKGATSFPSFPSPGLGTTAWAAWENQGKSAVDGDLSRKSAKEMMDIDVL